MFSNPKEMQVLRVHVGIEASIAGINWRYWGAQFGRGALAVENVAERGAVPIMPNAPNAVEVKGELKKMNKQLRQLIELQKKANLMAGCIFCCIIAIRLLSLLIRR